MTRPPAVQDPGSAADGRPGVRPGASVFVVIAVLGLLGVAMLASAFGNPAIDALPLAQVSVSPGPPRDLQTRPSELESVLPPEAAIPVDAPGGPLLLGCAALALVVALGLAWWFARGSREIRMARVAPVVRTPARDPVRRMRAAIDEGLSELDEHDTDPRRAVIACWVRLEQAAAEAGVARGPGDTSTDLVARVLAGQRVSADVLAAFAALYREARFARHTVDPSTRDRARAALEQLRAELSPARIGR